MSVQELLDEIERAGLKASDFSSFTIAELELMAAFFNEFFCQKGLKGK